MTPESATRISTQVSEKEVHIFMDMSTIPYSPLRSLIVTEVAILVSFHCALEIVFTEYESVYMSVYDDDCWFIHFYILCFVFSSVMRSDDPRIPKFKEAVLYADKTPSS